MNYIGEFDSITGTQYRVTLTTPTEGEDYNLTLGEPGVVITQNGGEMFQNIKPQSCTITINTTEDLSDLYTSVYNSNTVLVEDVTNNIVVFRGYITPNQYNQPYVNYNVTQIECVDYISSLMEKKVEQATEQLNNLFDIFKRLNAQDITTIYCQKQVLNNINFYFDLNYFYKENNEGDSYFDVINEALKTAGLVITSWNDAYYIFDNELIAQNSNPVWVNIFTDEEITKTNIPVNLLLEDYRGAEQNIEIDNTYSQIIASIEAEENEIEDSEEGIYEGVTMPIHDNAGTYYRGDKSDTLNKISIGMSKLFSKNDNEGYDYWFFQPTVFWFYQDSTYDELLDKNFNYSVNKQFLDELFASWHEEGGAHWLARYFVGRPGQESPYVRNARLATEVESLYYMENAGAYPCMTGTNGVYQLGQNVPTEMNFDKINVCYSGGLLEQAIRKHLNIQTTDASWRRVISKKYGYYDIVTNANEHGFLTINTEILLAPYEAHLESYNSVAGVSSEKRYLDDFPLDTSQLKDMLETCQELSIYEQDTIANIPSVFSIQVKCGEYGLRYNETTQVLTWIYGYHGSLIPLRFGEEYDDNGTKKYRLSCNKWQKVLNINNLTWQNNTLNNLKNEGLMLYIPPRTRIQGELVINYISNDVRFPIDKQNGSFVYPTYPYDYTKQYLTIDDITYQYYKYPSVQAYTLYKDFEVKFDKVPNLYAFEEIMNGTEDDDEEIKYSIINSEEYNRINDELEFRLISYVGKNYKNTIKGKTTSNISSVVYEYIIQGEQPTQEEINVSRQKAENNVRKYYPDFTEDIIQTLYYRVEEIENPISVSGELVDAIVWYCYPVYIASITNITDPYDNVSKRPEQRVIEQYNRHYQSPKMIYNAQLKGYKSPTCKYTASATDNKQFILDSQEYDLRNDVNNVKLIEI